MRKHDTHRPDPEQRRGATGYLARGAAAASVTGMVFMLSPAHEAVAVDNPYLQKFGGDNPLHAPVGLWGRNHPALADIDADGDLDLFIGAEGGTVTYFENTGTASDPEFTRRTGAANPFSGRDIDDGDSSDFAAPAFADLDNDGDLDAAVGADDGYLYYFENTGTSSAPAFTLRSGSDNPLWYDCGTNSVPYFADMDGDSDPDVVVGRANGYFDYLENNGDGSFTHYNFSEGQNPFATLDIGGEAAPALFADIDDDGDLDWFAGDSGGHLDFLANDGGEGFDRYDDSDTRNPFFGVDVGSYAAPVFADLDNDGDLDAVVGKNSSGDEDFVLDYFENLGDNEGPVFVQRTGTRSPFSGFDVGFMSTPALVDIDGDGDLDAFSGEYDEEFYSIDFFENTGTVSAADFVARNGPDSNPLYGVFPGYGSFVAFVDIDGDGDPDLFTGAEYSREGEPVNAIDFYENRGDAGAPDFVKKGDADNPLFFVETYSGHVLAFADIDGDGDKDAFVGGEHYPEDGMRGIRYYENVGSASAPAFAPGENPLADVFEGSVYGQCYGLTFTDVDGDGDLDAAVSYYKVMSGEDVYGMGLYENVGSASEPGFTPVAQVDDPFAQIWEDLEEDGAEGFLSFATGDIDGDGDVDVFLGEKYGRFLFFENTTTSGGGGSSGAAITGSGSGGSCFIDTASPEADASRSSWMVRARQAISRLAAFWR